jgi:teichoic acid transport system ATP-binding protein
MDGTEPALEEAPVEERYLSIRVRNLSVDYELFDDRRASLRKRLVTRSGTGRKVVEALKGVSLDVRDGDAVLLVGANGSGKSTLLTAIAGLLPPTDGEILVADEPKLLGVGAALLPAASGYRNIRLGLLALGVPEREVDEHFDEISDFCELGEALDRPLRTYSSGMRARLHFAIATAIQPRILLVDEALAVGDRRFKERSNARLKQMLGHAGTLIVVSHAVIDVREMCNRAIWIDQGVLQLDGEVDEVLDAYNASS